jgi:hypothetical protein
MPHAKIASKQAMFTLRQLHAELAAKLLDNKREARRLAGSMKHVAAVLKLLEPGFNLRPIAVRRRRPNQWFKRGTVLRHALDALRKADSPLTAREVTLRMLGAQGVTDAKPKAVRDLTGAVSSSLQNYKDRGVVTTGEGMPARYVLAKA